MSKGLYRLVSKNRIEIRVLRNGLLDELDFHLRFLTMNPDQAVSTLRTMQKEIIKNSPVIDLIKEYRPTTLSAFKAVLSEVQGPEIKSVVNRTSTLFCEGILK